MRMAMAEAHLKTRPAVLYCICLLFFIITVAVVNEPALVKADHLSRPSTLELYFLVDSPPVVASPSGSHNASEFGSISIYDNFARESEDEDSTVLGKSLGQAIRAKDGSRFTSFTYVLNTSGYVGSIAAQGVADSVGNGKYAITGGTGDFLSAKGYIDAQYIIPSVLLKTTSYIQYD